MYVYESHMGGFYASKDPISREKLYCEQCGDSDRLVGRADTEEEALSLLSARNSGWCDLCEERESCKKNPFLCMYSGEYSFLYILDFIAREYMNSECFYVCVIRRRKDGKALVNCHPRGYDWGEHMLPFAPCVFERYAEAAAAACCGDTGDLDIASMRMVAEERHAGKTCRVYEVYEKKMHDEYDSWCGEEDSYDYLDKSEIMMAEDWRWLEKYI